MSRVKSHFVSKPHHHRIIAVS